MTFEERARLLTRRFGDRTAAAILGVDPADIHGLQLGEALEEPAGSGGGGTLELGEPVILVHGDLPNSEPITPQDGESATLVTVAWTATVDSMEQAAITAVVEEDTEGFSNARLGFQWSWTRGDDATGQQQQTFSQAFLVPAGRDYLVAFDAVALTAWTERPLVLV